MSVRARIFAVVLVAVVPGFVLAFIASENERTAARHRAETQTTIVVTTIAERYSQVLQEAETLVNTLTDLPVMTLPLSECRSVLAVVVRELNVYDDLVIASPSGSVQCTATGMTTGDDLVSSPFLRQATTSGKFTVAPLAASGPGAETSFAGEVIPAAPGRPTQIIAIRLSMRKVGRQITPTDLPSSTIVGLVRDDDVVFRSGGTPIPSGRKFERSGIGHALESRRSSDSLVTEGPDGVTRVYTYRKLQPGAGMAEYAAIPTGVAFSSATHDFHVRLLALAIAALLSLAAAITVGEIFIARRVRSLVALTRRIAAGDFEARSGIAHTGTDEIGELEHSLDTMAEQLERRDEERMRLLGHVVEAAEAERRRIAGDVHDDSIQVMTAHVMALQLIRRRVDDPALAERLRDLEDSGRGAIARLRDLVFELHSPVLEELGLGPAIEALCERTFEGEPVRWSVVDRLPEPPPPAARDTAYRVAQEALQNARRHAEPSHVTVQLTREDDQLVASVTDDGRGFVPGEVGTRPGHRGLLGARERAEAAGGEMEIVSADGQGTTVTCRVPWQIGDQEIPSTLRATSSTSSTPLST